MRTVFQALSFSQTGLTCFWNSMLLDDEVDGTDKRCLEISITDSSGTIALLVNRTAMCSDYLVSIVACSCCTSAEK